MKSIKEIFRIGNGPSSSHTMGPKRAAELFAAKHPGAEGYRVTLYGSLAATGRGHMTDRAVLGVLQPLAPAEIVWRADEVPAFHPNGMLFEALRGGAVAGSWKVYSVGGGALATAGLFGNVVKTNASISGAEVGCQGEVGVACAMAAAAACQLFGGSPSQIEYAAEMALEHHLGLTCDPVCGLVQVPCIERNAIAAARAFDANIYASFSDGKHRVSFDRVVEVMRVTGHDIPSLYKETAGGGLAKFYPKTP